MEKLLVEKHDSNAIFRLNIEFEGENRSYTQYPLHRAVQTGNKDLIDILLKHGSDPNCMNGQGITPLYLLLDSRRSPGFFYSYKHGVFIVLLLIKAGSDAGFEFTNRHEKTFTPFHLALNRVTTTLNNTLDNVSNRVLNSFLHASQWLSACENIDAEFSILWLLAKSGAIRIWSRDAGCRLIQFEVALKSVHEQANLVSQETWEIYLSLHHLSTIQKHLQRCHDILDKIRPPMSLLDLCRIAVRQALGPGLEDKLEQLALPVPIKDCILPHDLQAIVDGTPDSDRDLLHTFNDSDSSSSSRFSDLSYTDSPTEQFSPRPYDRDNDEEDEL